MPVPKDPLLVQLAERVRARAVANASIQSPKTVHEWAKRYRSLDGRPFSLERYKPLQALYEDDWDRLVIMKPAQRGVSEWAICLACFALEYGAQKWAPVDYDCPICATSQVEPRTVCATCGGPIKASPVKAGINVAIVFPAKADLIDFSKERLSDLKDESTHLATMFGSDDFDALGFKKVGESYLYLRGGYSKAGLRSFPADMLILDEFEELATPAIALARRRMNASLVKREIMISTPGIPGRGISAAYTASDQRVYQTKCNDCGGWNTYDFFRDVRVAGVSYDDWSKWTQLQVERSIVTLHCPSCRKPQTDATRCATGRWIALQPEVTRTHGYHIPWWPFVFINLQALAYSAVSPEASEVEEFYHSDLGLPHGIGDGGITPEMLAQLSAGLPTGLPDGPWHDTTLGCDIGAKLHYRVSSIGPGGHTYVRAMGSVDNWDGLDHLMLKYQVRQAVVDAEPELHAAIEFCNRWPGRAHRAFYPTGANSLKGILFHVKPNSFDVQVNRVMGLDTVYHTVASARELWPREFTSNPDIIAHMSSSARIKVTDEKTGQQAYDWIHVGPDHLAHACLAPGTMVSTDQGDVPIENMTAGDQVWTRDGWRSVSIAGMTDADSQVDKYHFSDGSSLVATENHPIYTLNRGFVPIHAVTYDDILLQWSSLSQLSIGESYSGDTRTARGVQTVCISPPGVPIEGAESGGSTKRFGKTYMDLSLLGSKCTTKITIHLIMHQTILSGCQSLSTLHCIPQSTPEQKSTWIASAPWLTRGAHLQKDMNGTDSMLLSRLPVPILDHGDLPSSPVRDVERSSWVRQRTERENSLSVHQPTISNGDDEAELITWTASAQSATRFLESTRPEKLPVAPGNVGVYSLVRLSGKATHVNEPVYNLSVEGAEEYFANGILVHNCLYDMVARRMLPSVRNQTPAVGGTREVFTDTAVSGNRRRETGPSRLSVIR